MTREKAIEQEAEKHRVDGAGPSDICPNCEAFKYASFIHGVKWADENPVIWPKNDKLTRDASWYYQQAITQQELLFKSKEQLATLEAKLKIATEALEYVLKSEPTDKNGAYNEINQPQLIAVQRALQRIRE